MTTTEQIISRFCEAVAKPFSELETLTVHLEAALTVAEDGSRTEDDRVKELRLRIKLILV